AASSDSLPPPTPAPTQARHAARNPNEIVVTATTNAPKQDPLMAINKQTYVVMQKVDDLVVAPIALGYKKALPVPVRKG
ncbi:MlaA family lipoprotein, partial [Salmonella enterica]|uniref:MlaA family lipoprotein n=1 Tax=Salmonella enterica TaxID=28901 RepID=UPI003D2A22BC